MWAVTPDRGCPKPSAVSDGGEKQKGRYPDRARSPDTGLSYVLNRSRSDRSRARYAGSWSASSETSSISNMTNRANSCDSCSVNRSCTGRLYSVRLMRRVYAARLLTIT
jgi:hypothetical protein